MGKGVSYLTIHSVWRRRFAAALLISAALVAAAPQTAQAARAPERSFAQMVNDTRATASLNPLRLTDRLSDVARRHSKRMAERGELYHSDLNRLLSRAQLSSVGENVGMGSSLEELLGAFMASPPHAHNILGSYSRTGVGVYRSGGRLWITQIFAA